MQLILAVLNKRVKIYSGINDIFVNVFRLEPVYATWNQLLGGLEIQDIGLDLPLALSLASSIKDFSIPHDTCFIGEIGILFFGLLSH